MDSGDRHHAQACLGQGSVYPLRGKLQVHGIGTVGNVKYGVSRSLIIDEAAVGPGDGVFRTPCGREGVHATLHQVASDVEIDRAAAADAEGEGLVIEHRAIDTADLGLEFQGGAVVDVEDHGAHGA